MENMKEHKEIDLTQVWPIIKSNKKVILIITGVTTLLAVIYCFIATPIFTAKILINPPRLSDAGSGISNPLAAFTVFSGGGSYMQKTDMEVVIALLKTQSVSDMVVKEFNLMNVYKSNDLEKAGIKLQNATQFKPDLKSGFLEINVSDKRPKLAADIANYYVLALGQLISDIAYNATVQKVTFFEEQIPIAKQAVKKASDNLKNFARDHGILAGQQSQVIVGLSTQLQSQLILAQSQLQSMTAYATPNNPEYKKLQTQISAIKEQLNDLNSNKGESQDQVSIPVGLAPTYAQEWVSLSHELGIRENIYRLLLQQYESAKLDKLSDIVPTSVQVIDYARVPTHKSAPQKAKIILMSFFWSFLLSCLFVISRFYRQIIVTISVKT